MAITYESITSTNGVYGAGTTTITLAKPTGLAEGDLMICILHTNGGGPFSTSDSFTSIGSASDGTSSRMEIWGKLATAGDVADTQFQWTSGGTEGSSTYLAHLIRVSGTLSGVANVLHNIDFNTSGSTSQTYTPGLTPLETDSLYIMAIAQENATGSISDYAIANNNPTWTERAENTENSGSASARLAVATATPSSASASGDYSVTIGSSAAESYGALIVVNDTINVTTTLDIAGILTLSGNDHGFILDGGVTIDAPGILTISTPEPTITTEEYEIHTNQSKPSTSWTNQAK